MTKQEARQLINALEQVFDIVRLVDATLSTQFLFREDGELEQQPYQCYAVWNRCSRCENCSSSRALAQKRRVAKLEFIGDDIYSIVSKYVEVEGRPFVLEIVSKVTDEVLLSAKDNHKLVEMVARYNRSLYVDALTGVYNRLYLEDQVMHRYAHMGTLAMIDVDNFKGINDTYGHQVGDMALKSIAAAILSCVRNTDILLRYGGDEFMLAFHQMPREAFADKLEQIRKKVEGLSLEECPEARLSVSIGGAYGTDGVTQAITQADRVLYEAKRDKNRVNVCYCDE